jgi:tetratricopeptide (TPR) repeat protein
LGDVQAPFRSILPAAQGALAVVVFLSIFSPPVAGQQESLEVPPPSLANLLQDAPLNGADRATVEEAVQSRDYTRAEGILLKQLDQNTKSTRLLTLLGSVFFLDGKYLNCAIAMKKADAITPIEDRTRFTLAMAYIAIDKGDWARPELEKLAQSDPKSALYPYWLSRLDYNNMQFMAAISHLQKALQLESNFMKAYDNLGLCYDALGKNEDAILAYKQAVRLNREEHLQSPWPSMNLGALLVKLDRLDEAEAYLKESLSEDPRFPKAHFQLGLLLEKQKKEGDAIRELKEASAYDPSYPEPYFVLGRIYQRMGDEKNAQEAYGAFQKLSAIQKQKAVHRLH